MRILNCQNYYFIDGGSDTASFELRKILEARGHEVIPFSMAHPRNLPTPYARHFVSELVKTGRARPIGEKLSTALRVLYNWEARRKLRQLIEETRPDLVHLHNIYNHLSASILHELRHHDLPVVMTVHDYRLLCPNHLLFTGGEICERCKGGRFHHAVLHRCVRGSRTLSALLALESYGWRWSGIFEKTVDIFIAPSRFMHDKLLEYGFAPPRVRHCPYLVEIPPREGEGCVGRYALYFGRLVPSKGISTLLAAWRRLDRPFPLKLAGTGPMEEEVRDTIRREGLSTVECLGHLTGEALRRVVAEARFVLYPSEWYENFPLTTYETYLAGKPIILSNRGGAPEMVEEGRTGFVARAGDPADLADKIERMIRLSDEEIGTMGRNARRKLETEFHPDRLYSRLRALYEAAREIHEQRRR